MFSQCQIAQRLWACLWFCLLTASVCAAEPGLPLPYDGVASGQKPGAVLIYNFYTSSAAGGNVQNTRISITNTSATEAVSVRFFLIAFNTGMIDPFVAAGTYVCLAPNHTVSFLTSDVDPGTRGFVLAFPTEFTEGWPLGFNHLVGRADIKLATGHQASLPALAVAARFSGRLTGYDPSVTTATLRFDGSENGYDRLPRVLAVDKVSSRGDGNGSLLVLNRIGGNLSFRTGTIGFFKGVMYAEAGASHEFTDSQGRTQYLVTLSDQLPIFGAAKFEQLVPPGSWGWLKFWAQNDYALIGAFLNFNANRTELMSSQNLSALALTEAATLIVPIIQPAC